MDDLECFRFRDYIGAVFRRSLASFGHGDTVMAVLGYIAIIALGVVGGTDVVRDELGQDFSKGIAYIAVSYLASLILFITPYKLWRDEKVENDKLTKSITPRFVLFFRPEAPFIQISEYYKGRFEILFCIGVKNTSKSETINNVEMRVREIFNSPCVLRETLIYPIDGDTPFDLSAQQTRYIAVASWKQTAIKGKRLGVDESLKKYKGRVSGYHVGNADFNEHGRERIEPITMRFNIKNTTYDDRELPFGSYNISIVCYGSSVPEKCKTFRFERRLGWSLEFREMIENGAR